MQNFTQAKFELFGSPLPSSPQRPFTRMSSCSDISLRGSKLKVDVLASYLYKKCVQQRWFEDDSEDFNGEIDTESCGVVLKSEDGSYTSEPQTLNITIIEAVKHLRANFAVTMRPGVATALLEQTVVTNGEILLSKSRPLRILNNVAQILAQDFGPRTDGLVFLCKKERVLLICTEQSKDLLKRGGELEDLIFGYLWGYPNPNHYSGSHNGSFERSRDSQLGRLTKGRVISEQLLPYLSETALHDESVVEKLNIIQTAVEKEEQGDKIFDPDKESQEAPERKILLNHALMVCLVATVPLFATFSLFFMIVICGSLWQIFGPLSTLKENSKYYSAVAPKPGRYPNLELPHITIQMPVYKEGLTGVIMPTISSIMAAVRYYEQQGGTASIFINDDGMQLISKDLAQARKAYYELNNIGWCSRPKHKERKKHRGKKNATEPEDDGTYFLRKGKFKKASNMNYCLDFSLRVEAEYLGAIKQLCQQRGCREEDIDAEEDYQIYERARGRVIDSDNGRTWAAGDVRLGSIILIIDSDTRVPEDCLLYGALEMHESPELALLQHASGIMQVVNNVFEDGITYFTDLIYNSIQFAVGNGDCAPFVGHNTFIRWSALQSISWYDEEDKCTKFWSDSHVSEDFDVSLRMQMNDFVVRLACYHDGGFKEGVSLTVYDELARWEKYAYGCNELVFNPLYKWPYKGPFTKLFLRFIFSNIKPTSKITIFAYIGTYYAVASAIPLSLANYLIVGWLDNDIDQFYLTSWKVFVGMAVVFNILSPLGYAMLRHRTGKRTFFLSLWDTMKWTPMFLLFFGGISFHLMKAILCHFFSLNMEWTTTAKEYNGGFRVGLDRIVRDFKWMYLFIAITIGGMIYLGRFAPYGWTIKDFSAIVPLANQIGCHALLPFALGLF
ncbi:hypothetical protein CLAIMM_04850 [Cladophialophora immunda]|nr:hypothetical protein CLAIMM_04850 [Cladophialophora immunda]